MIKYLILIVMLCVTSPISAHDYARPELTPWFQKLHSKANVACCDGAEATHLMDPDWRAKDNHYEVYLDGQWQVVPDSALVDGPNLNGPALLWTYTSRYMDRKITVIRCFMPGTET